MSNVRRAVDILLFEPHQGGARFRRLVRDLYRCGLPRTGERKGDMQSRSHDFVLGIESRLGVLVEEMRGNKMKTNLDHFSVHLGRFNV